MRKLRVLELGGTNDLPPLASEENCAPHLRKLIDQCQVELTGQRDGELMELFVDRGQRTLNLSNCRLSDLRGVEQLPRLRSCLLWGNDLTSSLEKLYMSNNKITSLAPLAQLTNLKVLLVNGNCLPLPPDGVDYNSNVAIHRAQLATLHAGPDAHRLAVDTYSSESASSSPFIKQVTALRAPPAKPAPPSPIARQTPAMAVGDAKTSSRDFEFD